LPRSSQYGKQGQKVTGVGRATSKVVAAEGSAVMLAEIYFDYQPLFANPLSTNKVFRQEAVFQIRDDRNLTPGITGSGGSSSCS
jgi:hypothetical protein